MKIFYVLLFTLIFSVFAFGQSVQADLAKSLKAYKLVRINASAARAAVNQGKTITIPTLEGEFEIALTLHNIYAYDFKAEATTAKGRVALPVPELITYLR